MIVYFTDRKMNVLGKASPTLPGCMNLISDKTTDEVGAGVKTFEFSLAHGANRQLAESVCTPGNYLLKSTEDKAEIYTIIDAESDTDKCAISVYAEDAGLELVNLECDAFDNTEAYPVEWYIQKFTAGRGWEVGVNEIADRSRTLSWEGQSSCTERLLSIATQFDAEIAFSFEVDRLTVAKKYINVYKQRGSNYGKELYLGRELTRIITKRSISELATALKVTGGTPEGEDNPVTLSGYSYDDGDIYLDGTYLKSRTAFEEWGSSGHILKMYSYDTTSQSELCSRAVNELKRISKMTVSHEVDFVQVPPELQAGDIVKIVDAKGNMRYTARVMKIEESEADNTRNAELEDYEE